jgi:pentatricopeptide repeat domain-containing protein 3
MSTVKLTSAHKYVRMLHSKTDFVHRAFSPRHVLFASYSSQSSIARESLAPSATKITIPLRKKRDELSILQALASTVHKDYMTPSYKFFDDPYLIPTNNMDKRRFALAKVSGQKAAQFVIARYPGNFANDPADPPIEALMPPRQAKLSDNSLEGLEERISMKRPLASYESYQKLLAAGTPIAVGIIEDLLDLLCVYNSEDPPEDLLADELYFHRDVGQDNTKKISKEWKDDGAAEAVFKSLKEPSVHCCCSMIRGRAKYFQVDKAYELFQELSGRGVKLDVMTYNSILNIVFSLRERAEPRWELIQEILHDMAASGTQPNVGTFNAILFVLSRSNKFSGTMSWCMQTINEMHRLHIEPTLTTWYYAVQIHYANDDSHSRLLYNVVEYLKDKQLTVQEPTDYEFFSTAMVKCYVNLKDLELAYKLDALLNDASNPSLLGDSFRESLYYTHFMRLLCMFEQIDTVMSYYNRIVPHVYTPTFSVLRDVLTAIELNDGYRHLPRIWSDLVMFQYTRRVDLVEHLLSVMAKHKQDLQLQDLYVKVVSNILVQYEADSQNRRLTNPLVLTGRMLGDMIQIHLHADSNTQAWDILQLYINSRHQITGFPSESSLANLAQVCIKENNVDKTLETLSLMSDFGYVKLDELAEKVKETMQLTDHQRSHLEDLL